LIRIQQNVAPVQAACSERAQNKAIKQPVATRNSPLREKRAGVSADPFLGFVKWGGFHEPDHPWLHDASCLALAVLTYGRVSVTLRYRVSGKGCGVVELESPTLPTDWKSPEN
jgi:hypothetical protein